MASEVRGQLLPKLRDPLGGEQPLAQRGEHPLLQSARFSHKRFAQVSSGQSSHQTPETRACGLTEAVLDAHTDRKGGDVHEFEPLESLVLDVA